MSMVPYSVTPCQVKLSSVPSAAYAPLAEPARAVSAPAYARYRLTYFSFNSVAPVPVRHRCSARLFHNWIRHPRRYRASGATKTRTSTAHPVVVALRTRCHRPHWPQARCAKPKAANAAANATCIFMMNPSVLTMQQPVFGVENVEAQRHVNPQILNLDAEPHLTASFVADECECLRCEEVCAANVPRRCRDALRMCHR